MVGKLTKRGDRVLLGFDFSFGYPEGTASALGLDTDRQPPWAAMHAQLASKLKDKPDNSNRRYAIAAGMNYKISKGPFPFWGAPVRDQASTLLSKKGDFSAENRFTEYRVAERFLRDSKRGQPKSCWQLAYTGSVGSQSLMGIPHIHALREKLPGTRVWPFETELQVLDEDALKHVKTLIVEIYPSILNVTPEPGEVMDMAQVRAMARHYCDLDEKGKLGQVFAPPNSLDRREIEAIQAEEGWILGI